MTFQIQKTIFTGKKHFGRIKIIYFYIKQIISKITFSTQTCLFSKSSLFFCNINKIKSVSCGHKIYFSRKFSLQKIKSFVSITNQNSEDTFRF